MASPRKIRIAAVEDVRDTRLLTLESPDSEGDIGFVGGKWLMINSHKPLGEGRFAKRAYSILSGDADQRTCKIAVKRIPEGPASNYLHDEVKVGDSLEYSGPYGKLFHIFEDDAPGVLLVAAVDTGITAILGVCNSERARPFFQQLRLHWFLSDRDYFLDPDVVRAQLPPELRDRLQLHIIDPIGETTRMDQARAQLETDLATEARPDLAMLAGDGYVLHALETALILNGLDREQIRKDNFFNSTDKKPPPKNQANLRTGYTTGACSAAAAKAATRMLLADAEPDGFPDRIESTLPNGQRVRFPLKRRERENGAAVCSIIKDGGDDPDCTHLAELIARVELSETPGVEIRGGQGVAVVTLPGLGLEVGQPSITGVPRKNITDMVQEELDRINASTESNDLKNTPGGSDVQRSARGAIVTIEVPDGEERAKQTTNARLGLIGGISILGTTGIVKPYSTGAFRTSVVQAIDVAARRGLKEVVLTTGGKSEEYAMRENSHLGTDAFVQVGDFIGTGVKHAKRRGIARMTIFGMMGKLSKMADGVTQTHQAGSRVNMEMLATMAGSLGATDAVLAEIREAKTARRVLELAVEHGWPEIAGLICERVVHVMTNYTNGRAKAELTLPPEKIETDSENRFEVVCCMTDFDGAMLGQYPPRESLAPL